MPAVLEKPPTETTPPANGGSPFYVTGGTLPPSAASYITRHADNNLYEALLASDFCYVLNTRQIGKSSLMIRTVRRLKEAGAAVVVLDLTAVGQNLTPEQWYDGLLVMMSEQLHLEDDCEDFWLDNESLGPMQRFFAAISQVILPKVGKERNLIIFVDEIDAVRSLPFSADEFLAGIRECFNRRVQDPTYDRLTFCLLGVATPGDLIQDTRISPFNIGHRITLGDFTADEAAPLGKGMGPNGKVLLERAWYWTGGHPYLTQRLCREISQTGAQTVKDVDAICERLFLSKRALDSDDNLSFVQNRMLRSEFPLPDVLDFYGKLRNGVKMKDDETNPLCGLLRLAGIASVDESSDTLRLRNRIYSTVFDKAWVLKNMPDAELRRQKQAAIAAYIRLGSVAAVVIMAMGVMMVWALQSAELARLSERAAQDQRKISEKRKTQAEISEQHAHEAETVSNINERKAKDSAAQAKSNADRAFRNEQKAKASAILARNNESKAVQAQREAEQQTKRADSEANKARKSAEQAIASEAKAKASEAKAVAANNDAQVQRKEAIQQRQVAVNEKQRAEGEQKKAEDAAEEARQAKKQSENALGKLKDANYRRTVEWQKALKNNPTDISPAVELASFYMLYANIGLDKQEKTSNYEEAIKAETIVLQRQPGNARALLERGYCYLQLDRYDEAIADYTACIADTRNKPNEAYSRRAEAYSQKRFYDAALRDLNELKKLDANSVDYTLQGICFVALKRYDAAVDSFSHMLQSSNALTVAEGQYRIADARQKQGNLAAAYELYGRYQEIYPSFAPVYERRVQCLIALGRFPQAVKECLQYETRFKENGDILSYHAHALLSMNDVAGYRALCKQAMEHFGGKNSSAENANFAAWTCAIGPTGLSDYEPALRIAQRAVAQADAMSGTTAELKMNAQWANRNTLAALLYRAGQYQAAITELERCEAMPRVFDNNDRFGDFILLALCYLRKGDATQGAVWLRKARENLQIPTVEQRIFLKEADSLVNSDH